MTKVLYMTKGLPGSGKSTWAATMLSNHPNIVVVNKDDIRKELTAKGWTWSRENEQDVVNERNARIIDALQSGKSVISSDTNFGKHEAKLSSLAKLNGAEFYLVDFTHVPFQTCVERDARRTEGKVGYKVIKKMAEQNGLAVPSRTYVPPADKPLAIICDLDGTVALKGDRSPFDYAKVGKDKVNKPIYDIVRLFAENGTQIVYLSGREDWCRFQTEDWLATNGFPKGPLFMRPSNDHRKDYVVKEELFDKHIRLCYNVRFCLDDRDQVVKMWRELGLTCLQVAYGNF